MSIEVDDSNEAGPAPASPHFNPKLYKRPVANCGPCDNCGRLGRGDNRLCPSCTRGANQRAASGALADVLRAALHS